MNIFFEIWPYIYTSNVISGWYIFIHEGHVHVCTRPTTKVANLFGFFSIAPFLRWELIWWNLQSYCCPSPVYWLLEKHCFDHSVPKLTHRGMVLTAFPLYWHCSKISSTLACTSSYGTYSSLALGCLRVHANAFALGLDFAFAFALTGALASWVWTALTAVPAENSWSGVFCRQSFPTFNGGSGWACVDSLSLPCFQALATLWVFTDLKTLQSKWHAFPRETVVLLVLLEPWLWFFWLDLPLALLAPFPFLLCFVSLTLFFLLDLFLSLFCLPLPLFSSCCLCLVSAGS